MFRLISGWGTAAVALAGMLAAPLAGAQLTALALTTAAAVGVGAEAHARLHPRFGPAGSRRLDGFWIGPALAALAAVLTAGRLEAALARVVPFLGALLVGALLFAQDRELDDHSEERWTALAYALILYLIAFVLFVVIYGWRDPLILSALGCGVCAALLAAALYRPTRARRRRVWLFAGLTGLCVAELTLAVGAWIVAGLLGGAFLLLYFYVAAGLIHAHLDGSLDTRLVIEYGFVGLIGLVLIISTTPWRL